MPQMQDEAGNIWEDDGQGGYRLVQAAGAQQQGRVFNLAPNPKEQRKEARLERNDAVTAADREADNARADQSLALQTRNADLDRELKKLQIMQAQTKAGGGNRAGSLRSLVGQINRVQELFEAGPGSTSGLGAIQDYLPLSENKAFDAAGASLSQQGLAAFRVPGTGTVSDRDAIMFDKANLPQASNFDAATAEQLRGLRARVEEEYRTLGLGQPEWRAADDAAAAKPEQRADNEVPDATTGAMLKPPPPGGPSEQTFVATGDTRSTFDARMSSKIDSLINAGASKSMIDAILKKDNFPVLTPAEWSAVQTWRTQNPGKRYYGANISRTDELSMLEKASASPAAAFITNAGDAASAGILTTLAGEKGKGALGAMNALNPNASVLGTVSGGLLGAAGAEGLLAARAPAALAQYAPRISDFLYGGVSGFNAAPEGEGLQNAALGAGAGVLGGFVGDRGVRAAGAITGGVTDPAVRYLRDRGIPLTAGQTVGDTNWLGRTVKGVEDALTSLPGIGNMVDARRREGVEAFNRAAFQDAAAPGAQITATGAQGMEQVRQSVGNAYRQALDPVTIDANDPAFVGDVTGAVRSAQAIPDVNNAQGAALAALQARINGAVDPINDTISGRNFQEAYRGLARTGRERANGDYGHEIGQVMRQGQDALGEALERQNPGAFGGFLEANAANRRANVLAAALGSGGNQVDELITPAQLNRADITSTSRLDGRIDSAAGNRPFYELASAGQRVLPSRLPDSGTSSRLLVGAATTGALSGGGALLDGTEGATAGTSGGLALSLALGLGGTRTGQRAMTSLLADRPDVARQFGAWLQSDLARRIAGGAGAGTAVGLTSTN